MSSRSWSVVLAGGGWMVCGGLSALNALVTIVNLVLMQISLVTTPSPGPFGGTMHWFIAASWGLAIAGLTISALLAVAGASLLWWPRRWARRVLEVASWIGAMLPIAGMVWLVDSFELGWIAPQLGLLAAWAAVMATSVLMLRSESVHQAVESVEMDLLMARVDGHA